MPEELDPKDELIRTLQERCVVLVSENQRLFGESEREREELARLRQENADLREYCRTHPVAITIQGVCDTLKGWF